MTIGIHLRSAGSGGWMAREKNRACPTPNCATGRTHSLFYLSRCSCVTYDSSDHLNCMTEEKNVIVAVVVMVDQQCEEG